MSPDRYMSPRQEYLCIYMSLTPVYSFIYVTQT